MPREIKILYKCDCPSHHSYKTDESYDPTGWVSALPLESGQVIICTVESLSDEAAKDPTRVFFRDLDCLKRWLDVRLCTSAEEQANESLGPQQA